MNNVAGRVLIVFDLVHHVKMILSYFDLHLSGHAKSFESKCDHRDVADNIIISGFQ